MDYVMSSRRKVNGITQMVTSKLLNTRVIGGYTYCEDGIDLISLVDNTLWEKEDKVINLYSMIPSDNISVPSEKFNLQLTIKNLDVPNFPKYINVTMNEMSDVIFLTRFNNLVKSQTQLATGVEYDYTHFIIVNAYVECV